MTTILHHEETAQARSDREHSIRRISTRAISAAPRRSQGADTISIDSNDNNESDTREQCSRRRLETVTMDDLINTLELAGQGCDDDTQNNGRHWRRRQTGRMRQPPARSLKLSTTIGHIMLANMRRPESGQFFLPGTSDNNRCLTLRGIVSSAPSTDAAAANGASAERFRAASEATTTTKT